MTGVQTCALPIYAADIFYVLKSHPGQKARRLTAPRAAVAVDEQGRILPGGEVPRAVEGLQGCVPAAGDVALPVFLGGANVQQHRAGGSVILQNARVDVGAL